MSIDFRADLHCHTTCSDGTVAPEDLIQLACNKQLQGLAITDHDTIDAYLTAVPAAQASGIALISGIELSAMHLQTSIHILAYSFPLDSPLIQEFCRRHNQRRAARHEAILALLASNGMPLFPEDFPNIAEHHSIGRPHIASALLKKGYVSSIQQAFHEYIGEGKKCYAPGEVFSVEETLDLIHRAQGIAVIAHPHLIDNAKVLKDLLSMNFDGIEGHYARFPPAENQRWLKIAERKGWIITGGSDFHGDIKPNIPLGSSWVNKELFMVLYRHYQNNQQS